MTTLYFLIALENAVVIYCLGCLRYDINNGLVPPSGKTIISYFLKITVAAIATTLLYAKLWRIFYPVVTSRFILEVMGSFVAICVLRYRQKSVLDSFPVIMRRELCGIFDDFTAAPLCCLQAHRLDWRPLLDVLYKSASGLPRYALYGPILGGLGLFKKFFLMPLHLIQQVLNKSSLWCARTSGLPQAVTGTPLLWGGGTVWIGAMAITSCVTCMLLTHLSGTLAHRFFAHRCFSTSRVVTWVLYVFCSLQTQPIWWSSIHRRHHRHTDTDADPHPPGEKGFAYAYLGWLTDRRNFGTHLSELRDMAGSYPELLLLELLPIGVDGIVLRFCVLPLWTAAARFMLHMQWGEAPNSIVMFHEDFVMQAASIGVIFAVHMSLLFNAYAHQASDENEDGRPYVAKNLRGKWFDYLSSGESYHERHHKWPRLAQNSPRSREDWVYWFIRCMERVGLVWKVVRPNEKVKVR